MEQTKALNALEPFLALSKSATSPRAAADLIVRATSAPNTFIFTELLQTPQIQALASSDEYAPYLTLLQIFSHGTFSSYTSTPGLPALNDAQRLKLRQLSLLTLAKKDAGPPALDYASLQKELDLPSRQALEELVISDIYAGLLKAQLDPKASLVRIHSVSPLRDVAPTAVGGLLSSLQAWAGRCEATLESLSCQMAQLRADADRRAARAAARAEESHRLMENEQRQQQQQHQQQQQPQKGGQVPTITTRHHHISSRLPPPSAAFPSTAAATAAAGWPAPDTATATASSSSLRSYPSTNTHNSTPHYPTPHLHGYGGGGGGGGGTNSLNSSTTSEKTNSVLTIGGNDNRFLAPGGPSTNSTSAPEGAAHLQVRGGGPSLRAKPTNDSGGTSDDGGGGGGAAMDVHDGEDDPEGLEGKKRAGKRKLGD